MQNQKPPLFVIRFKKALGAIRSAPSWTPFLQYIHAFGLSVLLFLFLYTLQVEALVPSNPVPQSYKSLLLRDVPGPRLIIEAGSNAHHSLDAERMSRELGLTVLNIADNANYDLQAKINRIRAHARPNDTVLMALEWSYYTRDTLTDEFMDDLFGSANEYYHSLPLTERVGLAVSIPPARLYREWEKARHGSRETGQDGLGLPRRLYLETLAGTHGYEARQIQGTLEHTVSGKSCDEYVFGKHETRDGLQISTRFERALASLKSLQRNGVRIIFSWPVMAGDGCMTSRPDFASFRDAVETRVRKAGFEFVGTVMDSIYSGKLRDDNPYHLIGEGSRLHTAKMIKFLRSAGVSGGGNPLDVGEYLRSKIFEYEVSELKQAQVEPLEPGEEVVLSERSSRNKVAFGAGWWAQDPFGRLMRDNRAAIGVRIPEDVPHDAYLSLGGRGIGEPGYIMTASVDSNYVHHGRFDNEQELNIPVAKLPRGEPFWLYLDLPEAGPALSPKARGEGSDIRTMTVLLSSLRLTTSPVVAPMPPMSVPPETTDDPIGEAVAVSGFMAANESAQQERKPIVGHAGDDRENGANPQLAYNGGKDELLQRFALKIEELQPGEPPETEQQQIAQNWQYLPKKGLVPAPGCVSGETAPDARCGKTGSIEALPAPPEKQAPASEFTPSKNPAATAASVGLQPAVGGIRTFPLNNPVATGSAVADEYLKFDANWWNREPGGRWMRNKTASLSFVLPPNLPERSVIRLFGDVFQGSHQPFQVLHEDTTLVHTMLGLGSAVDIPVDNLPSGVPVDLIFRLPDANLLSPAKLGLGQDERELTGFVAALELRTHFAK